jgi:hypothetical protein
MSRALSQYADAEMAQRSRSAGEAIAQVESHAQDIANRPCGDPRSATFFELAALAKVSPERAEARWHELRDAARAEWQTGHRAAAAIDDPLSMSAWTRASFLALRDELGEGWCPRNGMERTLIDTLALSWAAQLFWTERMMLYACVESDNERIKKEGRWGTPRVADSQVVEQAAQMVDRFNRIFMRTLRALKDLRRNAPPLVVQSVGQMNVAEQQINMA